MIRKFIPFKIKRFIRILQRGVRDIMARKKFAKEIENKNYDFSIEISQPIFYNPLSANKIRNIQLATQRIGKVIIKPNETFSFWKIIGNPTKKKGYLTGRNIIGDELKEDIGGGLCQVSGIIYHLSLIAGLKTLERHCHTIDIYEEENRYTPLGSDATVVFGFKDLRFINNLDFPIQFDFEVKKDLFTARLCAPNSIRKFNVTFSRKEMEQKRVVKTTREIGEITEFVTVSEYRLPKTNI